MNTQVLQEKDVTDSMVRFRRLTPKVTGSLIRLRDAAYADGLVSGRIKTVVALAMSAAIRCQPCIDSYAVKAATLGASEQEVVEILNVTMAMQGCPGEVWAAKAFEAFLAAEDSDRVPVSSSEHDSCCGD
jgi:AhpD family alkylhydroperoxidase